MMRHNAGPLPWIYAVYDRPLDYPGRVVVRAYIGEQPLPFCRTYGTLAQARKACRAFGLVKLARLPDDDAKIVETWL